MTIGRQSPSFSVVWSSRLPKNLCRFFKRTAGAKGFVSIQGDPIHEEDPDVIIREALENRKVSPNICCKIPTTQAGLQAMEYLISQDVPLNATEIFAIQSGSGVVRDLPTGQPEIRENAPAIYLPHRRDLR